MTTRWEFYGRRDELGGLLEKMRRDRWFFGAIHGCRRIGKTALVQQALSTLAEDESNVRPALLVQLPDSNAADLAAVFRNAVREAGLESRLDGGDRIRGLPDVAAAVGALCAGRTIVALDEFQLCRRGPLSALPSLLQAQVDRLQDRDTAGGLIVLGWVQTEMEALLEDRKAPLFGRTTFHVSLGPWDLRTVFEVCGRHGAGDPARCLTLWTLFGGIPKYWRHFAETDGLDAIPDWTDWAAELCARLFLRSDALLREEGEALMGRELRRAYLAIFRTLAERRVCSHAELKEALPDQTSLGPYLKTLTRDLRLIDKELPVFAGDSSRGARYVVSDPFLRAWLAALQPACQAARISPVAEVAARLLQRLRALEGHAFERMVRDATEEASRTGGSDFPLTGRVRGYWNRPRSGPRGGGDRSRGVERRPARALRLLQAGSRPARRRIAPRLPRPCGPVPVDAGGPPFPGLAAGTRAVLSPVFGRAAREPRSRRLDMPRSGRFPALASRRRARFEGPAGGIAEGRGRRMMARALPMDRTAEFRLIVENGDWGAASLTAIHAVLTSAADVLSEAFGTPPDAPVRVARWDRDPQAFYDMRPYEIRISAGIPTGASTFTSSRTSCVMR